MTKSLSGVLVVLGLLALPGVVSAQGRAADLVVPVIEGPPPPDPPKTVARDGEGRVTVRAVRLAEGLVVDGRLDEAIYGQVESIDGFIQQEPHEGQPATERTEAWVFFDEKNVYIAARCWESDPRRRVANEMRRDNMNLFQNDHFGVIFDTFRDRRNGFMFYVNAIGGFFDGQTTDERDTNRDWNTVWRSQVGEFEGGWTVEMAIPFRSLRYRPGDTQIWGLNFRRVVRSKNETSHLTLIPAAYSRGGLLRLSRAATLVGIQPGPGGVNLEMKPYATGGVRTDVEDAIENDSTRGVGFDLKYGLTRGLTFDFTYNTDFAQVEDDEQRVNLTRFSLFFPEKREFFLEGQGIFTFGGVNTRGGFGFEGPSDTPILFFSRRIGLSEEHSVPVVAGGRLTGKAGAFAVGLLQIRTDDEPAAEAVRTDFSVLRVKRDIFRRSTIGLIATRRAPAIDGGPENSAVGVDAGFSFFQNLTVNSYYARTRTPGRSGDEDSYRAQLEYAGDRYGLEVERLAVGEDFNPEVGFVRRGDMIRNFAKARFSPRPASLPSVRKFGWEGSVDYITDGRGRLETRERQVQFRVEFQSGDEWNIEGSDFYEVLDEPFEISDEVSIPSGGYHFRELRTMYRLGPQRKISGFLNASWGEFYDGDRAEAGYRGRVEITPAVSLEPGLSRNWVDLPYGRFTTTLASARATLTLSPRMFVGALLQYSSSGDHVATNIRYRWEYVPGSDLFVVYSEGRDTAAHGFPTLQNRVFVVKMAHLLRF
jgi:hypothetical protein